MGTNLCAANSLQQDKGLPEISVITDKSALKYINEAQVLIDIAEYEKSLSLLKLISKQYKGDNKEVKARILGGLARNYLNIGLFKEAVKTWSKAIELCKGLKNGEYLSAVFYNNIASAFLKLGESEKAIIYYKKSLSIYPFSSTYRGLSKLAIDTESDFDLSKSYLEAGAEFIRDNRNPNGYADALDSSYLFKFDQATILKGFAYHYFKMGDVETSIDKYQQALDISKRLKRISLSVEILKEMGYVYRTQGDLKNSNKYFAEYIHLNDSLSMAKMKSLSIPLRNFIVEENNSKEIDVDSDYSFVFGISALVGTSFVLLFIVRHNRRQKKKIEISRKEKERLKQSLNESFDEVIDLARNNDPAFLGKFKQVYPSLYGKLSATEINLTDSEIALCAMIWLKFSTKEIAQFTFVQHKTVQIKKYRLRKKLSLPKGTDLYKWMASL